MILTCMHHEVLQHYSICFVLIQLVPTVASTHKLNNKTVCAIMGVIKLHPVYS